MTSEPDGDMVLFTKGAQAVSVEKIVLAAIAETHTKEQPVQHEAWGIRLYDVDDEKLQKVRDFLEENGIAFDDTGDPNE